MSLPFIILSTWKIKEGKAKDYKKFYKKLVDIIDANEPQLIGFHAFFNEDETEITGIQVHQNAASMDFHMQVLRDKVGDIMQEVAGFMEPRRVEYYGDLPNSLKDMKWGEEVTVNAKPLHIGGFTRSPGG